MRTAFIILSILLASCGATRKATTSHSFVKDSTAVHQVTTGNEQYATKTREEKDSTLGISGKQVTDSVPSALINVGFDTSTTLSARSLTIPVFKKIPIYKEKTVNGLKAWVLIDTNGTVHYGAKSDSFTIVVKGLIRERDSFRGLVYRDNFIKQVVKTEKVDSKTVVKEPWLICNWYWVFGAIALIVGILCIKNLAGYLNLPSWILKLFKRG